MSESHSDALVFFGATGDLAYKTIFPYGEFYCHLLGGSKPSPLGEGFSVALR